MKLLKKAITALTAVAMCAAVVQAPVSGIGANLFSETAITAEAADLIYYRTTGTYVNLRKGPTTQSSIIRTIKDKYTAVQSYEKPKNGWLKLSDGSYISAKYVERISPTIYKTVKYHTTGTYVNVRTGPGTNYPVAFSIPAKNTGVDINSLRQAENGFLQMTTGLWIAQKHVGK
ncbi:MAG: SH3 domain-containing protein [Oscillospiraceae bacterium]|nr:SH3 domain-containing protein [Oscillospiraceae bacterium]